MVVLTFANGLPNSSLQIGDLVYYVSNPNTNYELSGFTSDDGLETLGDDNQTPNPQMGLTSYVLIGTVSSIQINNDPLQAQIESIQPIPTTSSFTLYVEEQNPNAGIIPPSVNDYIFFTKDNAVNLSSIIGYYNKITLVNDSVDKAELFSVGCEISQSSK